MKLYLIQFFTGLSRDDGRYRLWAGARLSQPHYKISRRASRYVASPPQQTPQLEKTDPRSWFPADKERPNPELEACLGQELGATVPN